MLNLEFQNMSLDEKLEKERRICPDCNYMVDSPFIERCPRCFSLLPEMNVDCTGCAFKILCPTEKNRKL